MRMNITIQSCNIWPELLVMMPLTWFVSIQNSYIILNSLIEIQYVNLLMIFLWFILVNNKTLAPRYDIGWEFFDTMVRDHIVQYNYTLNPEGIFGAIKYMYTYYPDPNNRSHIREEFINVSLPQITRFNLSS